MSRIEDALSKAVKTPPMVTGGTSQATPPPLPEPEALARMQVPEHMLLSCTSPQSPVAEEYRKLKEAFIREASREGFNNVVLVTSANPKEGKTVTTLNLAVSLAQELDYTVLVVDADLRAPACSKYLGIETDKGLADCLTGDAGCTDVLIRTDIGRLVLLPAGKTVANPAELLSSSRMRQLIQELKHRYPDRFIIIDAPPAKYFAETRFLASVADASILVVREGETSLEELEDVIQALGGRIMGIVYNDAREAPFRKPNHYAQYAYAQQENGASQ